MSAPSATPCAWVRWASRSMSADEYLLVRAEQYREARADVAELIEAVKHLRDCGCGVGGEVGSVADRRLDDAKDRVDAALARMDGAA